MNVNVTIEIRSIVSEAQKHFTLAMPWRRAAFSGNTSLIATFSSVNVYLLVLKYPNFVSLFFTVMTSGLTF